MNICQGEHYGTEHDGKEDVGTSSDCLGRGTVSRTRSSMKTVLQHAHWGHFYVVMLSCTLVLFVSMVVMVWAMTKDGTTQLKVDGQILLGMLTFLVTGLLEIVGNHTC